MNDLDSIINQLQRQRDAIDQALAALRGGTTAVSPQPVVATKSAAPAVKKRRTISAEGRRRMAEAQRARWAAVRAPQATPEKVTGTKKAVKKGTKKAVKKAAD